METKTHTQTIIQMVSELDSMPSDQKHRVTGFIPETDFQELFHTHLTFHGAQAKVVSALVVAFSTALRSTIASNPGVSPTVLTSKLINGISFNES